MPFELNMSAPCASQHFGVWAVESQWLRDAIAAVNSGIMKPMSQEELESRRSDPFVVASGGIAVITIHDQITKGGSSFGGTSSLFVRKALRIADADDEINGIMLHIDSPGGTVAGTPEMASAILNTSKPIRSHIDDLGASAAFWAASQTDTITVNATGAVGSIGTLLVVADSSENAEKEGIKVHVISTGEFKGAGVPGTPITDAMIDSLQERVDDINAFFLRAVSDGRALAGADLDAVTDGRVFIAHKAQALGLVDGVMSFEEALDDMAANIDRGDASARARARVARARLT